jgi:hypothetical protein
MSNDENVKMAEIVGSNPTATTISQRSFLCQPAAQEIADSSPFIPLT